MKLCTVGSLHIHFYAHDSPPVSLPLLFCFRLPQSFLLLLTISLSTVVPITSLIFCSCSDRKSIATGCWKLEAMQHIGQRKGLLTLSLVHAHNIANCICICTCTSPYRCCFCYVSSTFSTVSGRTAFQSVQSSVDVCLSRIDYLWFGHGISDSGVNPPVCFSDWTLWPVVPICGSWIVLWMCRPLYVITGRCSWTERTSLSRTRPRLTLPFCHPLSLLSTLTLSHVLLMLLSLLITPSITASAQQSVRGPCAPEDRWDSCRDAASNFRAARPHGCWHTATMTAHGA